MGNKPLKRKRGRPVTMKMPDPIPDTPAHIAQAVLTSHTTPLGGWWYLKNQKAAQKRREKKG